MPATKTAPRETAPKSVWSAEEKRAMREGARERKTQGKGTPAEQRAAGEAEVQAKIAQLPADERAMAARVHEIITKAAPNLVPRTFYGSPAYSKDGKVVCFFQEKSKFKVRYSTLGFQSDAKLDDGAMWPVAFAVLELTPAVEAQIAALAKKAS
jgi:uncharacterized protein YdhG (YjbR/CyaY superfamily)